MSARDLLRKCYLFESSSDELIEALAAESETVIYKDSDPIFLEGETSHHVYFVQEGEVEIVSGRGSSGGKVVSVLKEGDYFSELSVLANSRHSVSSFARQDTTLVMIEGHRFVETLQSNPKMSKEFAMSLGENVRQTLERSFAVRPLDTVEVEFHPVLTQVFPVGLIKKYKAVPVRLVDKTIHVAMTVPFHDEFFQAFYDLESEYNILISTVESGQYARLQDDYLAYYAGLKSAPKLEPKEIVENETIVEFLQYSLAFSQIPSKVMAQILPYFNKQEFQVGQELYKEGQKIDRVFVVYSGTVELTKQVEDKPLIVHLETAVTGDSIGEIAAIGDGVIPFTAVAAEQTLTYALPVEAIQKLLNTVDFSLPLAMAFANRLQTLNKLPGLDLHVGQNESEEGKVARLQTKDQHAETKKIKREKLAAREPESLLEMIIIKSVAASASDIHLEFSEEEMRVRCRIDGVMVQLWEPVPIQVGQRVVNRLKVISSLDIAEKRLPQDGQFELEDESKKISGRVSTVPTRYGEKAVIRILRKQSAVLPLNQLAPDRDVIKFLNHIIKFRQGLFLVAGPTGSGKTTTLYSVLAELAKRDYNIVTIEDPVELEIPGVNQIQLNNGIGLTYKRILKSVLRQDPDVILVGEIRDAESLQLVFEASLTGHLVLATIHAPNTIDIVHRLIELGASPAQMASSLIGVISQRLVRKTCDHCKSTRSISREEISLLKKVIGNGRMPSEIIEGKGCDACNMSGFLRRLPVFEFWQKTEAVSDCLLKQKDIAVLHDVLRNEGFVSLGDYGLRMVGHGLTTVDEVENTIFGLTDYDIDDDEESSAA